MAYTPHTPEDLAEMLAAVGVARVEELFETVPEANRLNRPLDIPASMNELELTRYASEIAGRNQSAGTEICFMGGGFYDHFIPALVDQLAGRSEFYTAYTPYQAEASQGTLQAIFEFQTLVAELTGMDLANASLYECATAVVEAAFLAMTTTGRLGRIVMSDAVHPEHRQTLATYLKNLDAELVVVPSVNQRTRPEDIAEALTDDTAAVVIQHPNFFGNLEDAESLVKLAQSKGALAIMSVDPISLGLLKNPGTYGADIVVAEGQSLGNILSFGGPSLGLFACRSEFMRKMPGRLVGETVDRKGKRCYTLTLQTRRVWVGDHENSCLIVQFGFQIFQINQPIGTTFDGHGVEARDVCRRWVGSMSTIRHQHIGPLFADTAEVGGCYQKGGQLSMRSGGWLKRYRVQARNFRQIILEFVKHFQQALD